MKNRWKMMFAALICLVGIILTGSDALSVSASGAILPEASHNLVVGLRRTSELVATDDGYMRVFFNGKHIGVEYYDEKFNIKSKKSIEMELEIWGGFFAGETSYYVVEGKNNLEDDVSAEVIRVIQYDKNWNKTGSASITSDPEVYGGEIRIPFSSGCVEMTECDGMLYIATGHQGYLDAYYGMGHQGFLMIAVDEATMKWKIVAGDYGHSFTQFIDNKGSDLYVLEQREGSRCTALSKYNREDFSVTSFPVLEYGGTHTSAWAIACYASVDGMALSQDHVLCLGTSIDQSKYDEVTSDTPHNLYLTVTPMGDFSKEATEIKWLTNFTGEGKAFLGAAITKINDNRFMVSWEVDGERGEINDNDALAQCRMHYVFIDGKGNKISREYTAKAPFSGCQPIVKGSKVVYYASSDNMLNFYTIDANSGAFTKKKYRLAGENATWKLKNGVLTISGTGNVYVQRGSVLRYPVSYVSLNTASGGDISAWGPITSKVEKIVIKKGLDSISDRAFQYSDNLKEVVIEPGLKSIGASAFYSCNNLATIEIPSSVKKIGEDFLWTGYVYTYGDGGKVVRAVIYAPVNSYAIKYAKKNNIRHKEEVYVGAVIKDSASGAKYKIKKIDGNNSTVEYKKYVGSKSNVVIPDTIVFSDCVYKVVSIADSALKGNQKIKKITIGGNVKTIGENAFYGCTKLKSVTFGKKVTTIGNKAFCNCKNITSIVIPSKTTKIGSYAFKNCKKMAVASIGKSVKVIGKDAFKGCASLKRIKIKSQKLKAVGKDIFKGIKYNAVIIVPEEKLQTYKKLLKKKGQGKKVKIIT